MMHTPQLALVTGASSGIGLELAQQCVAQGADVILVALTELTRMLLPAMVRAGRGSGVSVTTLCPGPTESGFLQAAGGPPGNVYHAASAAAVAQTGYQAMARGEGVVVTDRRIALQLRLLPRKLLLDISYRRNRSILAARPSAASSHERTAAALVGGQAVPHSIPPEHTA